MRRRPPSRLAPRPPSEVFPAHAEASLPKPYEDVPAASLPRAQEDKFPPHAEAPRAVISADEPRATVCAKAAAARVPDYSGFYRETKNRSKPYIACSGWLRN